MPLSSASVSSVFHKSSGGLSRLSMAVAVAASSAVLMAGTASALPEDRDLVTSARVIADIPVISQAAAQLILARDAGVPVVILGARLTPDCARPGILEDRLDAAAKLLRLHPLNPVIVTGGVTQDGCPAEATSMEWGLRERLVINPIIQETEAGSTLGNVANTKGMIMDRGGLAVVVTSSPHQVRALQNYRDAGVEVVAYVGGED